MIRATFSWLWDAIQDVYTFVCGFIMTTIGYFIPIKSMVHVLLIFFFVDMIVGYWAARKLRGESFSAKIVFQKTVPRAALVVFFLIGLYLWDKEFDQNFVESYKLVGWFIGGVLLVSIAKHGFQATKWHVFNNIGNIIKNNLQKGIGGKTGSEDINHEKT